MDILVCIKQVPGTSNVEVDPVTGVLKRDGVASKLNPYDLYAIELALQLKEQYGGTVKAVTMGPPQARSAVLEAVYMGADSGCVVSDRKFAGADVLATSYTLSQCIRRTGQFDLIICGKQTTDGDTAQVGAELAEFLGIPHHANVSKVIDVTGNTMTIRVSLDNRIITQRVKLPCLIAADADINTPRLPSYRRMGSIRQDVVEFLSLKDFEDQDEAHYGLTGSPTQVQRIFPPDKSNIKQLLAGDSRTLADKLYGILKEKKFL